jgi:WD40 repeat protein
MLRSLVRWAVVVAALVLAAPATAAPAVIAPMLPRVVLQASNYIEAAAWTARDDFIVSVSGFEREVTIWDVARGVIVDRIAVSMPANIGNDLVILDSVVIDAAGTRATIRGRRFSLYEILPERTQDWLLDLTTRRIVLGAARTATTPAAALPKTDDAYRQPWVTRLTALTQLYAEDGFEMTDAQAVAALPPLPRSHDGRWGLARTIDGIELIGTSEKRTISPDPPLNIGSAALSPDGKTLAMVVIEKRRSAGKLFETDILLVDPATGRSLPTLRRPGSYGYVQWQSNRRLMLFANDDDNGRDASNPLSAKIPAPTLVVDIPTRKTVLSLAPRCYVTRTTDGFVAGGLGNCRTVKADRGLWLTDAEMKWNGPIDLGKGIAIDLIAAAPDGKRVATAISAPDDKIGVTVHDAVTFDDLDTFEMRGGVIGGLAFVDGGKSLMVAANGTLSRWRIGARRANGDLEDLDFGSASVAPQLFVNDGRTLALSGVLDAEIARFDLANGKRLPPLAFGGAVSGGFMPGKRFWAVSMTGALRVWDLRDDRILVTSQFFAGEKFFAMTPEGRYDTNFGADAKELRWLMPDAPWQSLAPQTFMRDLYEPGLVRKIMACGARCTPKLGAILDLATLNRTLPSVDIVSVAAAGGRATVTLDVQEISNPGAANGKTRSGIYDVRLFRDGRLVRQTPGSVPGEGTTVAQWRDATRVPRTADTVRLTYDVALPKRGGKTMFSAYAFNEDRVKGETARRTLTLPPPDATPPRRRVVVFAIGVDATRHPAWRLSYAANDAGAVAAALKGVPDADVATIALTSDARGDHATKRNIRAVLLALGGQVGEGDLAALAAAGVEPAALRPVGPDDAVVIAFSGHGTTRGESFFLLPSDAVPDGAGEPVPASLISAAELTAWLRDVDAGEIAFVLDACHSAASVDSAGFKPGPMGDPGLGQLAFDKGIRILAATQANDVAVEDGRLGHGLLSYALGEGLDGKADADKDGQVTLGEWLGYGVARMPGLAAELRDGRLKLAGASTTVPQARGPVWFDDPDARVTRVQQPSLFDFTGTPGALVLRRTAVVLRQTAAAR